MSVTGHAVNGRGCGHRKSGEAYLCCGTDIEGLPIEHFILDPAIPWTEDWQRGYKTIRVGGVSHVIIFVGRNYYPSPWDFIEEARIYGASRRVHDQFPFAELTPGKSKMLFCHARAIPNFAYGLPDQPKDCQYGPHPAGWHKNIDRVPKNDEWWEYNKPCTFGLRSLATFHNTPANINWENRTANIIHPSFSYEAQLPEWYCRRQNIAPSGSVDFGMELGDVKEIGPDFIPFTIGENLSTQAVKKMNWTGDEDYKFGVFLTLPISHIEAKDYLKPEVAANVNQAGFDAAILGY